MRRSIILLTTLCASWIVPAAPSGAEPREGKAAQRQDPVEPAGPVGFERRDIEEMDRRIEEKRQRWRDEEAAKARAKKQRRPDAPRPVAP